MVGIRLSNDGVRAYIPKSKYFWASSDGTRTEALRAVSSTGADWDAQIDPNEAKRGFLIFPIEVGPAEGAYLHVGSGNEVPERIPLGNGAATSAYPVAIASGQSGQSDLRHSADSCLYPTAIEVRDASLTLDAVDVIGYVRPTRNERFVALDIAFDVQDVTGDACDLATKVFGNLLDIRLVLENGDRVPPTYTDFDARVGSTSVVTLSFPATADVSAFELVVSGESVAQWTDITFPDP